MHFLLKIKSNSVYCCLLERSTIIVVGVLLFCGGMAERLNAAVLKTVDRAIGPWVQIPLPPPFMIQRLYGKVY